MRLSHLGKLAKQEAKLSKINILLSACLLVATACSARAPSQNSAMISNRTKCILPADQGRGSLQGAWASIPIPIVFDRDFYTSDNGAVMPAFRAAAETWNYWASVRGMQAFRIIDDGSGPTAGRDIPEITSCDQASYSSSVTDAVGIWKIGTAGFHANIRSSCGSAKRLLAFDQTTNAGVQGQTDWIVNNGKITGASILLNFEGFNAPGRNRVDAESLLLHEMGHVLGLLHSCNGSSGSSIDGTSAPNCTTAPTTYTSAVMFPYLETAQERRSLMSNDFNRINCLY